MLRTAWVSALCLGVATSAPALAQSPNPTPAQAPYVVVPFAPPGNRDRILGQADAQFVTAMQGQGVSVVSSSPMDVVDAALGVPSLCDRYHASGVILGVLRHEQHAKYFGYPAHAEVRLFRISCAGKILWRGIATGDANSNDARKSEDNAAADALANVVEQLSANLANL